MSFDTIQPIYRPEPLVQPEVKPGNPSRLRALVKANSIMILLLSLWAIFDALSVPLVKSPDLVLDALGFCALMIVPGALVGIAAGWLKKPRFIEFGYVIGVSLLVLMILPLVGNAVLPRFGISNPLNRASLLILFNAFVVVATIIACIRKREVFSPLDIFADLHWRDFTTFATGLIMVVLAILGATSLNNGGTDLFTMVMLFIAVGYVLALIRWNARLKSSTTPIALVLLGMALLFMTSLRGWSTTGHDIQRETLVFELAKNAGLWLYSRFPDPYNACLSITILPTVFAKLLKQPDPYVYKVYFQAIFAITPALIYVNVRRYIKPIPAILAALYFVAYPTFFTDMPFLNRQEIAFVLLGLMILALFDTKYSLKSRRILFIAFGLGLIFSHYATTYATMAILLMTYGLRPGVMLIMKFVKGFLKKFKIGEMSESENSSEPLITLPMLALLLSVSLLWTGVITNASTGLASTVDATIAAMQKGFSEDSRSNDANALLYGPQDNSQAMLQQYVDQVVLPYRDSATSGSYYGVSTYSSYDLNAKPDYVSPQTKLGQYLTKAGVNVGSFIDGLKAASPKLIALFAFTGMAYAVIRRKRVKHLPPDLIALAIASLVFVCLQIILPEVSIDYGLARAYQQALFVLSPFLVIGSYLLFSKLPWKRLATGIPVFLALVYFLSNTGVITQLTGAYAPNMNLSNAGLYYDIYYSHESDIVAGNWLNSLENSSGMKIEVQAERYAVLRLQTTTSLPLTEGIYPGMLHQGSYVFLDYTNVHEQQSTIFYNGDLITYSYPISFLDNNKNLIYSNGSSRIYQ